MHVSTPVLFCLIVGLIANPVIADQELDELKLISKIELLGGKVTREETPLGRPVVEVDFEASKRVSDNYLHLLRAFPHLETVNLNGCERITDAGLAELQVLANLTTIRLIETQVTASCAGILAKLPRLQEVELSNSDIAVALRAYRSKSLPPLRIVEQASAIEKLRKLGLEFKRDLTAATHPVTRIDVERTDALRDADLPLLRFFPNLNTLYLWHTRITDDGLKEIARRKQLTTLVLAWTKITDVGLAEISQLTNLRTLDLRNTPITDRGLQELKSLDGLTRLLLFDTKIGDNGLDYIKDLELTHLDLHGTRVTDHGLKVICGIRSLTSLNLSLTPITDAGVSDLTLLNQLTELVLIRCTVTDAGLQQICALKNLTNLNLANTQVTDEGLKSIGKLDRLTNLTLSGTNLTNKGLAEIPALENLTHLSLASTAISNDGIAELSSLKRLVHLDLRETRVTQDGATELQNALPGTNILR